MTREEFLDNIESAGFYRPNAAEIELHGFRYSTMVTDAYFFDIEDSEEFFLLTDGSLTKEKVEVEIFFFEDRISVALSSESFYSYDDAWDFLTN